MPWLKQANHGKKAAWLELEMNMLAWITFCCENFFFWKIWLKTRVCIIHGRVLYTSKYCKQALMTNSTFFSCQMEKMDLWNVLFIRCLPHSQIWECKCLRYSFTGGIYWRNLLEEHIKNIYTFIFRELKKLPCSLNELWVC